MVISIFLERGITLPCFTRGVQLLMCVYVAAAAKWFDLRFHETGVHRQRFVIACAMFLNSRLGLQVLHSRGWLFFPIYSFVKEAANTIPCVLVV